MKKKKGLKKNSKLEAKKDAFNKLNDDEKNDLVSQEIELVQTEIEKVCCGQVAGAWGGKR